MRRAIIAGLVSVMLAVTGSTFVGGMFGLLFAQAQAFDVPWENLFTDERIPAAATSWAFVVMAVMVLGVVGAIVCGRIVLIGLGVRNPVRTLRWPIGLLVAGAVLTVVYTFPLWFVLIVVGAVWGIVRVYDEAGPRGTSTLAGLKPIDAEDEKLGHRPKNRSPRDRRRADHGGDLSDWS